MSTASTTATTPTKKAKELNDWTSEDHSTECAKLKAAHTAEAVQARAAGKNIRPFQCLNQAGCCPEDVLINAGISPVIIGAQASVPNDSPRVDVGDRRQGAFYEKLLGLPGMVGLQRVKMVPVKRLAELEKMRRQRLGLDPADWIVAARKRAADQAAGKSEPNTELSPLQRAAQGLD